ncbi:MAG: DUF1611 domain-containing protein [Calditrichaeota bacterium]|nr:DUF1611 domain-containing protein [Calditrichota bacterium]RQW02188.1 MAG: DUF1611 domain-containing protein [Calditrichota bacterium]
MVNGTAIILTGGWLPENHAKTAHGLLRKSERFSIKGVVDPVYAGKSTGEILKNDFFDVPVYKSIDETLQKLREKPQFCIIGVAVHGGKLPDSFRREIEIALQNNLSVVSGLHTYLSEDPHFKKLAAWNDCQLIDVRKPRPVCDLRFWTGEIYSVPAPRIAMLGMDCVIGKRTTARILMEMLRSNGIKTELIYTGQTGWMQGLKYGFIFDATVNDFIGGEIERAVLECYRAEKPDLILIEGQSSLRNPSGPCGSEFILSGDCKGVILQHAPGRIFFDGMEKLKYRIPDVEDELKLIEHYGARPIAITLNEQGMDEVGLEKYRLRLEKSTRLPVLRPLKNQLSGLLPAIHTFIENRK